MVMCVCVCCFCTVILALQLDRMPVLLRLLRELHLDPDAVLIDRVIRSLLVTVTVSTNGPERVRAWGWALQLYVYARSRVPGFSSLGCGVVLCWFQRVCFVVVCVVFVSSRR